VAAGRGGENTAQRQRNRSRCLPARRGLLCSWLWSPAKQMNKYSRSCGSQHPICSVVSPCSLPAHTCLGSPRGSGTGAKQAAVLGWQCPAPPRHQGQHQELVGLETKLDKARARCRGDAKKPSTPTQHLIQLHANGQVNPSLPQALCCVPALRTGIQRKQGMMG